MYKSCTGRGNQREGSHILKNTGYVLEPGYTQKWPWGELNKKIPLMLTFKFRTMLHLQKNQIV